MSIKAELVLKILERATSYPWTVQGLGMLRLYLGKAGRIHIWTPGLMVPNVSVIHNHFWDLKSEIISGTMINKRYNVSFPDRDPPTHHMQSIVTGEGGGLVHDPESVILTESPAEQYKAGDVYTQSSKELHESRPSPFTVTVMERPMGEQGKETASVCWPIGTSWVSAEPRPATIHEILMTTMGAMRNWSA